MQNILDKFIKTLSSPEKMISYWAVGFVCFASLALLFYLLPLNLAGPAGHATVGAAICFFGIAFNQTMLWWRHRKLIKKFMKKDFSDTSTTTTLSSTKEKE